MESHAAPLRAKNGVSCAQLAVSHDITDRKRAEEELKEAPSGGGAVKGAVGSGERVFAL